MALLFIPGTGLPMNRLIRSLKSCCDWMRLWLGSSTTESPACNPAFTWL